jgi:hypothetical protein
MLICAIGKSIALCSYENGYVDLGESERQNPRAERGGFGIAELDNLPRATSSLTH